MFNLFLPKLLDTFESFCVSCGGKYLIKFGLQSSTLTQRPVVGENGAFHVGVCVCVCAGESDADH